MNSAGTQQPLFDSPKRTARSSSAEERAAYIELGRGSEPQAPMNLVSRVRIELTYSVCRTDAFDQID